MNRCVDGHGAEAIHQRVVDHADGEGLLAGIGRERDARGQEQGVREAGRDHRREGDGWAARCALQGGLHGEGAPALAHGIRLQHELKARQVVVGELQRCGGGCVVGGTGGQVHGDVELRQLVLRQVHGYVRGGGVGSDGDAGRHGEARLVAAGEEYLQR